MGRVVVGLILILGVVFLVRGFLSDVKKHQKPPTQYIVRDDSRVDADKSQMTIKNMNDFVWNNPTFVIKERYKHPHQGAIRPQSAVVVPFDQFKDAEGKSFSKDEMVNFEFDIRTATMARSR